MRFFVAFLFTAALAFLSGCANSGYQKFYKPYADARQLQDVELLVEGQEPRIVRVNDLARERDVALSRGYRIIGESSFNGAPQAERGAVEQAKAVGASLVLVSARFTNTQTVTTPLYMPNNQTTYQSGSVYGSGGFANYNGSSTTYGSTVVPITSQVQRYDQAALYFVKSTARPRLGVFYDSLTPELRTRYERNVGVVVRIVMEGSPAFNSNILVGDVITELNGTPVNDRTQFAELLRTSSTSNKWHIKLLRNGVEKAVELMPNP